MSKFYTILLFFAALMPFIGSAQTVTIGTGTASSYLYGPYYRSSATSTFNYSMYAYLYNATELSIPPGSMITAIEWQHNAGTMTGNNTFEIYLDNSALATFPGSDTWNNVTATSTNVYASTTQSFTNAAGWEMFNLSTPYLYTGGSLMVATNHVFSGTASGANSYYYESQTGMAIGIASGSALSGTSTLGSTSYSNRRPNIRITYVPGTNCSGTPVAGMTTVSTNATCPSADFTLGLSGNTVASGLTYQWQYSINGIDYFDIPGATNATATVNQTVDTYYQCVITCTGSGLSDISTPEFVSTNSFLACYCGSNSTSALYEEIFNVQIGSINNASNCSTTGGAGSVLNQYSDYSSIVAPADLAQTATYNIGVQVGSCGTNANTVTKVFIDYNQNGSFTDPGEEALVGAATPSPYTQNGAITIPGSALLGITKMRVVSVRTSSPTSVNPCGTYTYGETEDYYVNITPVPSCPQPSNISVDDATFNTADISWTAGGSETQWQIEYGLNGFAQGTGTSSLVNGAPSSQLSGLSSHSVYQFYIRSICGIGDTSVWSGPVSFNTFNQGAYMEWNSDCPLGGFVDISATGVLFDLPDDGEVGINPIPFDVMFQGLLMSNMSVGNNGGIQLGNPSQTSIGYGGNFNTLANGFMFIWGDDLDSETGDVFVQQVGTSPNSILVIQWNNSNNFSNGAGTVTFQIQIDEMTGEIYYVYDDVIFGGTEAADDYAGNADIGLSGPNQDITVSTNNQNYLQNNSCVHFYYTDCPKPQNLSVSYVTTSEAALSWTAGLSNETNWVIVYGPAGFDPNNSGITINTTMNAVLLPGLDDLTTYDFYVYADCDPGVLQSVPIMTQFTTLPNCADPTGLAGSTATDSLFNSWNYTANAGYPVTEFAIEYGMSGFTNGNGTQVWGLSSTSNSSTIEDAALIGGGVYQVYVQAICNTDTSSWVGPISLTMPLTNDSTCFAEMLSVDGSVYVFDNAGATAAMGESAIAPTAGNCTGVGNWCNSSVNFSTWFTFVAPNSGNIRIDGEYANFNGQIAVYTASNCGNFNTFNLVSANDDYTGADKYPYLNICGLTPGNTYYLMHDSYSTTATGVYSLRLREVDVEAGTDNGIANICSGDLIDLNTQLSGADMGGYWTENIPTVGLNDPIWNSAGLASQVFTFEYHVIDGCAMDSVQTQVKVFSPSYAGLDGGLTACLNEPITLNDGLSGNGVDLGGTWYNPSNNVTSPNINSGQVPGQFNYDYIAGNGVCANDTANIILTVDATCNFLDLQEASFSNMELHPNPTTDVFYITNSGSSEVYNYVLMDLNGKIIDMKDAAINGVETTEISMTGLETGMYLIRVYNENAEKTFRVMKH